MLGRSRWNALAAAALTALALGLVPSHAALASGTGGSGNPGSCDQSITGNIGNTTPTQVAVTDQVHCEPASAPPGQQTTAPQQPVQNIPNGTACTIQENLPEKVGVSGSNGIEYAPNHDGTYGSGFSWGQYSMILLASMNGSNIYFPWVGKGTYQNNQCVVPAANWTNGCIAGTVPPTNIMIGNVCWVVVPNPLPTTPLTNLPGPAFNSLQNLISQINKGALAVLPQNPNAGLVGLGTCFFIAGANIGGTPINQPAPIYQMTVPVPANDGTNRFIFYVLRMTIAYTGVTWNFGDNSSNSTVPLPGPCAQQAQQAQLQYYDAVAHVFDRYGTFTVTATENYAVTVDEYYSVGGQNFHQQVNLGLNVPIQQLQIVKTIVQEEGVPVAVPSP